MRRKIEGSVAVITGAGSGIGRATAEKFAARGASLVLGGRSQRTLANTADSCRRLGARVETFVLDIRDERAVRRLAALALDRFGGLDTWVNNAGVAAYGRFGHVPPEVYDGVIRTNLFGYMYGMRAALPIFERQQHGVVINNLSIVGKIGVPKFSSYAVSKAALFMLSECIRQELQGTDIHVCVIVTPSVDTGVYQRSANYTGLEVRPFPPIYDPETIADAIVGCAERPRRQVNVGAMNRLMEFGHTFTPALFERVAPVLMEIGAFQRTRPAGPTDGNVLRPRLDNTGVRGGWLRGQQKIVAGAAVASVATGLLGLALATKRKRAA